MAKHAAKCPKCGHRVDFDTAVGGRIVCAHCHASLKAPKRKDAAPPDPLVGQALGQFEILERLGQGGMGAVYKGRQPSLGRLVAVKVLAQHLADDASFVERFHREARAAAAISHPNIIEVHDVGEDRGYHFIAMEFVDGESLADVLKREGRLAADRALALMKQVASALAEAHGCGILHRDIKPSNILFTTKGHVKVADFGLAKHEGVDASVTTTGQALGTPLYIPPESARGQKLDARSDLYSLGATFYQALAGRPPFDGATPTEVIVKHLEKQAPPLHQLAPDCPPALCRLIHRLLRKNPAQRYESAEKLLEALERVEARAAQPPSAVQAGAEAPSRHAATRTLPGGAARTSPEERREARRQRRRRALILAGGGAAALVLALILALTLGGGGDDEAAPQAKESGPPPPPTDTAPAARGNAFQAEQDARTCFSRARQAAARAEWATARQWLDRLGSLYATTRFVTENRAAVARLRAEADAALRPPPPKAKEPPPPKSTPKPQPPPDDDERWTDWQELFDGKSLEGWRIAERPGTYEDHGEVRVQDGSIIFGVGNPCTGIAWTGEFPKTNYEVCYEAKAVSPAPDFASAYFPVGESASVLVIASGYTGLDCVDGLRVHENPTRREWDAALDWHAVRLRVTPPRIQAWVDRVKVVDQATAGHRFSTAGHDEALRPFGLMTYKAAGAVRRMRLRRLKPEAPPAGEVRWGPWQSLFDGKTLAGWKHEGGSKAYVEDGALVSQNGTDLFYPAKWTKLALECELKGGGGRGTHVAALQFPHEAMGRGAHLHRIRLLLFRTGELEVEAGGARLWKSKRGAFPIADWLRLGVQMTRDRLRILRDGKLVREIDISAVPPRTGGLYFYSYQGHTARLRNPRVRALKGADAPPAEKPERPAPADAERPSEAEVARALDAYQVESDRLWALFKERQYDEAAKRIAQAAARPEFALAAEHIEADAQALKLLKEFWVAVEKGMAGLKGRTMVVGGAGGALESVRDGVITIKTPRGELKTGSLRDLAAKQAAAYSGLRDRDDARSQLTLGVFLLAEEVDLDDAEKALQKAGNAPSVAIYKERLEALTMGAAEAAAKKAWLRIEEAAKGRLSPALAKRLNAMLAALEKQHGGTKFYKGLGEKLPEVKTRIEDFLGYTRWPFDAKEARRRQRATAQALGVPVEQDVDLGGGVKMTLVLIPAGEFLMGSPPTTSPEQLQKTFGGELEGYRREFPQHRVRISKPFWLGKYEVTQEQWQAVMGDNPSRFKGKPQNPVEQVSWRDCQGFLQKLSARVAQPPSAVGGKTQPRAAVPHFRLPTEAEWEYACRAGAATEFYWGDDAKVLGDYAWMRDNSGGTTQPVGRKKPNAWGLHDMAGNVWEWCEDWFAPYGKEPQKDPKGPPSGASRVVRGGSWLNDRPGGFRCAYRNYLDPGHRGGGDGFRASRTIDLTP